MPAAAIGIANARRWVSRLLISRLTGWLVQAGLALLARLPPGARARAGGLLGAAYHRFAQQSRAVTRANLAVCFPELSSAETAELVRASMRSTAAMIPEVASCWKGPPDDWRALIHSVSGAETMSAELATGRGVLTLGPHLGNWELLNMYMGAEFGLAALYDPPKITALEPLIRAARERTNSRLLPIGPSGLRALLRHLRAGGLAGILPDQVPAADAGLYADFFARPALTMNFAARLIEAEQAAVFVGIAPVSYTHLTLPTIYSV